MGVCDGMHPMNVLAVLLLGAALLALLGLWCNAICFSKRKLVK